VEFAFANPRSAYDFIKVNAQEMQEEVMYNHIKLYVNEFSIDLGIKGKAAVNTLYQKALDEKIIPGIHSNIFV
jgi:1,4-dihydroxy-6-naphthoate synthase